MTDTTTTAASGPVTLDEVRQALGETPATQTNAGALRRVLGRGSLSTIQKHLDALRAEAAAPVLAMGEGEAIPAAPADLVAAVWSAAWAQAQARTHGALAVAQGRVEALDLELGLARADASAAQSDADLVASELEAALAQAQGAADAAKTAQDEAQARIEALGLELEKERAERAQDAKDAQHAMALVQAQSDASQATLRAEVDRLVSQLADLRAALSRPVVAAQDQA